MPQLECGQTAFILRSDLVRQSEGGGVIIHRRRRPLVPFGTRRCLLSYRIMVDISQSLGVQASARAKWAVPLLSARAVSPATDSERSVDFTNRQIAAMFVVLAFIEAIPI